MPSVFVPGTPVPQGSARGFAVTNKATGKTRAVVTHANPKTMPWRQEMATVLREAVGNEVEYPEGPVSVDLEFVMPRRKAEPKRQTPPHTRKPDIDKLERAVLDSMTGIVFKDDAQVVELRATKRTAHLDEQSGLTIRWEGEE